jgi:thiosulfate dehydrogenase [quinone] large subunit
MAILRAFLGITFVYAGIQKLADPGYLTPGAPTSFATQVSGFAQGSPIAFFLNHLAEHAFIVGIGVAIGEILIGLATLAGFFSLVAAIAGFAINVALWLSATWHSHPYFTGADSIYAVAWAAYGYHLFGEWHARTDRAPLPRRADTSRRNLVRAGALGAGALVIAGFSRVAELFGPSPTTPSGSFASTGGTGSSTKRHHTQSPQGGRTRRNQTKPKGQVIANLDKLQVGAPIAFSGPSNVPGVLVRLSGDKVVAYSRICTHAGCIVGYDSTANLLVCPCHGAEFDPTKGAQVVAGPAPTPLRRIPVGVDPSTRQVYLTA